MKVTPDMTTHLWKIKDALGAVIPFVTSFDTETCEIEIMCPINTSDLSQSRPLVVTSILGDKRDLAKFKGIVPGAYLEIDGKRYDGN